MKYLLEWSEIKPINEIINNKLFDFDGVYLHFLKLQDDIPRIIYVGCGNIYGRQRKYYNAYSNPTNTEFQVTIKNPTLH